MRTVEFPQLEETGARNTLARAFADPEAAYVTLSARVSGSEDGVGRYNLTGPAVAELEDDEDEDDLDDDIQEHRGSARSRMALAGDVVQWAKDTASNNMEGKAEQVFRLKVYALKAGRTLANLTLKAVSLQDTAPPALPVVAPSNLPSAPAFGDLLRAAEARYPDDPVMSRFSALMDLMGHGMGTMLGHTQRLLDMTSQTHAQQTGQWQRLSAQSEAQLTDARQTNGLLVDSLLNARLNEADRAGERGGGGGGSPDTQVASDALSVIEKLGEAYLNRDVDPDMAALYGTLQNAPETLAALKDPKVRDYLSRNAASVGPLLRGLAAADASKPAAPAAPPSQEQDLDDDVAE